MAIPLAAGLIPRAHSWRSARDRATAQAKHYAALVEKVESEANRASHACHLLVQQQLAMHYAPLAERAEERAEVAKQTLSAMRLALRAR